MDDDELYKKEQALLYWNEGSEHQMQGRLSSAAELYLKSIDIYPTAEAHTFLGWVYSMIGRLEDAIEECHRAIRVDPDFGNPYNDIGAYLIQLGEYDAAIPWFEQAILSPRYDARAYPHMNLGRVWEHRL
ncbi:MAG: tetratricopeptide repeat protein, partial [Candidatus Poribacteria bacterium]|nr:tetratricopeptide repeat protein [Candidatus Poribacteria bacterium]